MKNPPLVVDRTDMHINIVESIIHTITEINLLLILVLILFPVNCQLMLTDPLQIIKI